MLKRNGNAVSTNPSSKQNNSIMHRPSGIRVKDAINLPSVSTLDDEKRATKFEKEFCRRFPAYFVVYVYSEPRVADQDTLIFRRKQCAEKYVGKIVDKDSENTMNNIISFDKRLMCVQRHTGCEILLSPLNGFKSLIKGEPRRRLVVAGSSYSNIALALAMIEHMFPRLMSKALYRSRFPANTTTKFICDGEMGRITTRYPISEPSNIGLNFSINEMSPKGSDVLHRYYNAF